MRIGTLEKPSALSPDVHIYTRSKQPWLQLPGSGVGSTIRKPAEVCEAYYDSAKLWPAASLARRKAVFG